jgi:hypothetical protein
MTKNSRLRSELVKWLETYWNAGISGALATGSIFLKDDFYHSRVTEGKTCSRKQDLTNSQNTLRIQQTNFPDLKAGNGKVCLSGFFWQLISKIRTPGPCVFFPTTGIILLIHLYSGFR